MWFGTHEGVSRFDGYGFTNYTTADGLGHPIVTGIFEDPRGRLWLMWLNPYDASLARLIDDPQEAAQFQAVVSEGRQARGRLIVYETGDPWGGAGGVVFDRDGTFWCVLRAGAYRVVFDEAEGARFELVVPRVEQATDGYDLAVADSRGRLWFSFAGELTQFVDGRIIRYHRNDGGGQEHVRGFVEDRWGRVVVATADGLYEVLPPDDAEGADGSLRRLPLSLPVNEQINCLAVDADGTLWIGTTRGLRSYHEGRLIPHALSEPSATIDTTRLYFDREGNLWVGSSNAGLYKLDSRRIVSYTLTEGLPGEHVIKVFADREGRIYVSTEGQGVAELTEGRAVVVPGSQAEPFNTLGRKIIQDRRGRWWAQTREAVLLLGNGPLQFRRFAAYPRSDRPGPTEAGDGLFEDSQGRIWSSQGDSLYRITPGDDGRLSFARIDVGAERITGIMRFAEDPSGVLWLGQHGNLGRLTAEGRVQLFEPGEGLPRRWPKWPPS